MKLRYYLPFFLLFFNFGLKAQSVAQYNAAEIKQGLESLNVTGSVLYIAAHPDDENTRLLAYLAKGKKVRTGYLSLTRGDGGQNLIGTEQADLLGLVRTQELLAARKVDGAEQFFTRANDFGFSKTSAECLKIWGHQKILGDVVWVIRKFQPDVIITRFPEDSRAGHGAHAASAILAREAFLAAADPKQFPEQLKQVKVWKTKRIVWNTFNFGGNNTTAPDQLTLEVGGYNPILGLSYGEIAAESRSNHRSQGFGSARQRDSATEFFSPIAGQSAKTDLFEGIDFSLNRYPGTAAIQKQIKDLNDAYQVSDPSLSLKNLLKLKQTVNGIPFKHQELDKLILACAGIWIESSVDAPAYAITDSIPVKIQAISRLPKDFPVKVTLESGNSGHRMQLNSEQTITVNQTVFAGKIGSTQPYWLLKRHGIGSYESDSPALLGLPENPFPSAGSLRIWFDDVAVSLDLPLVYKFTDPARGEIFQPLVVAPPITATLSAQAYVFNNNQAKKIRVTLRSFKDDVKGILIPEVPDGWAVSPKQVNLEFKEKGSEQDVDFTITPGGQSTAGTMSLSVQVDGVSYNQGYHPVEYAHIPLQTFFPFAEARLERVDLKFAGKQIGYIPGAGDLVLPALREIGYNVTVLNANQVIHSDLSAFDAIVTGVRLYNINPLVAGMQPKLMEYVKNGGTLLVQYNVNAPLKINNLGPYPFKLSRDRVTEEDADVQFIQPADPLLNYPNKITAKDFKGWVQERGIYFTTDMDPKYKTLFRMRDTGEAAQDGALIAADYGKGKYIYTGLVFYRELPAGVPGAYRLIVNLISAGRNN